MAFKIPFSGKAHNYSPEEVETVIRAMGDAEPYTQGRYQARFEEKFAAFLGVPRAFAVSNATNALEMCAQLCRFSPGDEVIIPSHTFTASAYPFAKKGAKIVWADIDPATRVVSAETIAACLSPRTKAVVVVHLYGFVADMGPILELARERGILVIEDAAQSIGASLEGRLSGSFGDMGVFSLHSHKNITTLGEGGVLYVKDPTLAAVVPMLRHNGHCPYPPDRPDYWVPAMGDVDMPRLDGHDLWPNNFCLGEIQCALGAKLLERVQEINRAKRARALRFIDALADYDFLQFHRVDAERHNYHLLAAKVTNGKRDEMMRKLAHDKGVQCVVQYYPLNRYPFYQKLGLGAADCPHADEFFDSMISFPFHHWMSEDDFAYMLSATRDVLAETV